MINKAITSTIILLALLFISASAQVQTAVFWDVPDRNEEVLNNLSAIEEAGIHSVIISGIIEPSRYTLIHNSGLDVIVQMPVYFPHRNFFSLHRETFNQIVSRYTDYYGAFDSVSGLILLKHGALHHEEFFEDLSYKAVEIAASNPALKLYLIDSRIQESQNHPFEIVLQKTQDVSVPDGFNSPVIFSFPRDNKLISLNRFLSESNQISRPVWMDWNELGPLMESDSRFAELIRTFSQDDDPIFPNPRTEPDSYEFSWPVFLLIVTWLFFAGHFRYFPKYRNSIFRYFFNYTFFTKDVIERLVRFGLTNVVLLLKFSFVSGLVFLAGTNAVLSPAGFEALGHYYPALSTHTGIFFAGFVGCFVLHIFLIIWLSAATFRADIFSQTAVFQLWPLHLTLIIVTLMVTLDVTNGSQVVIYGMIILFFAVHAGVFFLSSQTMATEPTLEPWLHHLLTTILYAALLITCSVLIISYTEIPYISELILSL